VAGRISTGNVPIFSCEGTPVENLPRVREDDCLLKIVRPPFAELHASEVSSKFTGFRRAQEQHTRGCHNQSEFSTDF
jgi:hypothetical protein